ncbi:hypothetical protein [Hydrogenimonas sp.]|uniref:hypothetical protein n=1 Tax=Hydrogenimonas sp. TaxID=2231112 RepID=UPI002627A0AF|nr:hypothetical protein [Hydrogenimonas sp.]
MYHIHEWFITDASPDAPLCHPTYPSTCKRRFRLLKKRQSVQYARDLNTVCKMCLEKTEGKKKHVTRLNALIDSLLAGEVS